MKDTTGHLLTTGFAIVAGVASQFDAILHSIVVTATVGGVSATVGFFVNKVLKHYFK